MQFQSIGKISLTFAKLCNTNGPIVDLVRTRSDIQARFISYSHGGHLGHTHS